MQVIQHGTTFKPSAVNSSRADRFTGMPKGFGAHSAGENAGKAELEGLKRQSL